LSHVKSLWRDEEASKLSGVDRLVYRSNTLGADLTLTNTGGGNTSSKLKEKDPLTGESVEVLWVKGSGGDLRTAKRDGFASLYVERVRAMKPSISRAPDAVRRRRSACRYCLWEPRCRTSAKPRPSRRATTSRGLRVGKLPTTRP
jgi:rhamnose utilization protein RhaD (predicted bifunctional aldolase and dehydrogenase)